MNYIQQLKLIKRKPDHKEHQSFYFKIFKKMFYNNVFIGV